jgi:flagellar biosynthesis protein FlhG
MPADLHILASPSAPNDWRQSPPLAEEQLLEKLDYAGVETGMIIIDGGNRPDRLWRGLASAAEMILVVATHDPAAIVGAHTAVKMLQKTAKIDKVYTLVNQVLHPGAAEEVYKRLYWAGRRFLGINLHNAGYMNYDPLVNVAAGKQQPFALCAPDGRASRQIRALAEKLLTNINAGNASVRPLPIAV